MVQNTAILSSVTPTGHVLVMSLVGIDGVAGCRGGRRPVEDAWGLLGVLEPSLDSVEEAVTVATAPGNNQQYGLMVTA